MINDLIAHDDCLVVRGKMWCHGPLGRFIDLWRMADGDITDPWTIITFDRGWSREMPKKRLPREVWPAVRQQV